MIVAGPTASGKTGLAIELAEELNGEIISADSRQIYCGLDIGTAKPTPGERSRVAHHLLDVVDAHESYSAGRFAIDAGLAIEKITGAGKTPVLCGGTGFYIEALLRPMFAEPETDPELKIAVRTELAEVAGRLGREELHRRLSEVDPASAARLHPRDFQRVSRALEVFYLTGRTLSQCHAAQTAAERYAPFTVILDPPREEHLCSIRERAERMFEQGWVEEVERLLYAGVEEDALGMQSLGYDEVKALVQGRIGRDEALENIIRKTRQYARRQRIWFQRMQAEVRGELIRLERGEILRGWRDHAVKHGDG